MFLRWLAAPRHHRLRVLVPSFAAGCQRAVKRALAPLVARSTDPLEAGANAGQLRARVDYTQSTYFHLVTCGMKHLQRFQKMAKSSKKSHVGEERY